jgi:hypothetical protein
MIEECRYSLFSKVDHTIQYVVLSNEVGLSLNPLTFACPLKSKAVCIVHLILLMLLISDPERIVNTSSS